MRLSPHFSLDELLVSETAYRLGIDMTPTEEIVENLIVLCNRVLEPLREAINVGALREHAIIVTSGYRPPGLNRTIGGSKTSAHMSGRAADCYATGMSLREFAEAAEAQSRTAPIDQVILEFDRWIHLGMADHLPRRQVLTASRRDGQTVYDLGLPA